MIRTLADVRGQGAVTKLRPLFVDVSKRDTLEADSSCYPAGQRPGRFGLPSLASHVIDIQQFHRKAAFLSPAGGESSRVLQWDRPGRPQDSGPRR